MPRRHEGTKFNIYFISKSLRDQYFVSLCLCVDKSAFGALKIGFAEDYSVICTMSAIINKRKIINDPVHGFIIIPTPIIFDLLEHPYVQRLRRIKQLGLTSLVYPGATHTRFQHALGAVHLMSLAIENIR